MEDQLSLFSMLSLKELSLKRMAINLWNEPDILDSIVRFFTLFPNSYCVNFNDESLQNYFTMSFDYLKKWREDVESQVTDKIMKLSIPKSLANQLLLIITPIGLQINRWKGFHEHYLNMPDWKAILKTHLLDSDVTLDVTILSKLCWTSHGKVDYCETAKELIRCEMLDIVKRYTLACMYCLEDFISVLWAKIPKKIQRKFYKKEEISFIGTPQLEFCWPYILKEEQYKLNDSFIQYGNSLSFNQYAFADSACRGNKAAAEYFFQKLTPIEKESSFFRTTAYELMMIVSTRYGFSSKSFPLENMSESFIYLLSLLNFEEQIDFLKRHYCSVLLSFVELPWNDIFLKIANYIWDLIPGTVYNLLLHRMREHFTESQYCFPKFFQEIFIHCPLIVKKEFVYREIRTCDFFHRFFYFQDSESIKVILTNLDVINRLRVLTSKEVFIFFYDCVLKVKLDMVKVCLEEASLSKNDREKLKRAFSRFLTNIGKVKTQEGKLVHKKFIALLNEIYPSPKRKRCLENKSQNNPKKLCSNK